MSSDFIRQYAAARAAGAPLIAIRTPDPAATIRTVMELLQTEITQERKKRNAAVLAWDVMNGLIGLNDPGRVAAGFVLNNGDPAKLSAKPTEMLRYAQKLALAAANTKTPQFADAVLFMHNAHNYWAPSPGSGGGDAVVRQAIWNLRDLNKATGCQLLMLCTLGAMLPDELAEDVLVLDEPLPDAETLRAIVKGIWEAGQLKPKDLTPDILEKAVDATIGLAAFPAEQAIAMSMSKSGLDLVGLWERKRQIIEQTPGLSVWRGGETFDQIGGVEQVKKYLRRMKTGKNPPRVVVFVDEIEKAFAGMGTDSSGVKTEMTGTLLTWMQDKKARGVIFIGPPGAAKSGVAKAAGNDMGVPTIYFDLSAMQNALVGRSGERLRGALKVIDAISQGRAFFIATCNKYKSLPPELRRRFKRGTWFFALPTEEEREAIWNIYMKRFPALAKYPKPDADEWTGAEIEQCCEQADEQDITLEEAAEFVVPVARSAALEIAELCEDCNGKFISASAPGVYKYDPSAGEAITVKTAIRKLKTGEINISPTAGQA